MGILLITCLSMNDDNLRVLTKKPSFKWYRVHLESRFNETLTKLRDTLTSEVVGAFSSVTSAAAEIAALL